MTDQEHDDLREKIEAAAEAIGGRIMSDVELAAFVEAGERAKLEHDDQARAEGRRFLDEEHDQELIESWYATAERMTADELPAFVADLIAGYRHDYGTICHAIAAAAIAGAYAVERSPTGGITGFQAGAVMWEFIRHWDHATGPMRLMKYDNLLYPQYEESFGTISAETWAWVQAEAQKKLNANPERGSDWLTDHWQRIVDGQVPFGLRVEKS